jgi:hypothetical protein
MAVTEKLIVDMQADTKQYTKSLASAEDSTRDLSKAIDEAGKSNLELARYLKIATDAYGQLQKVSGKSYKDIEKNALAYDAVLKQNSNSTASFEKNVVSSTQKLDEMTAAIGSVQRTMIALNVTIAAINFAFDLFDELLSGQLLKNLRTALSLFALIADVKGYDKTTEFFDNLVDTLDKLILKLESFNQKYQDLISKLKNSESYIEKSRILFDTFENVLGGVGIAAGAYGINKVGQNFDAYKNAVNPALDATKAFAAGSKDLFFAVNNKLVPSLLRFGELTYTFPQALSAAAAGIGSLEGSIFGLIGTTLGLTNIFGFLVGFVFNTLFNSVGNLAVAIGQNLVASAEVAFLKFEKFNQVMNTFKFTIEGFGKTLGVDAVGSVQSWLDMLDSLRSNTVFTTEDIAKSIKLLVAEGSRFGLTTTQIGDLIKRNADVASAFGENIVDMATKINSTFAGNAQSMQNMGFAVSDASFAHSELFLSLGKTAEQLTKNEKASVRLDLIMTETAAVAGAAANEFNSAAGSAQFLNRTINDLDVAMGKSPDILNKLRVSLGKIIEGFTKLADPILAFIGTVKEATGVVLILAGTILKHFVLITSLTNSYTIFNRVLAESVWVQNVLSKTFLKLGAIFKFEAIQIKSATDLFKNFNNILKAIVVGTLASLGNVVKVMAGAFVTAAKAAWAFTASILSNPLFYKITAIVGGLYILYTALKELSAELGFIRDYMNETGGGIADTFDKATDAVKTFGANLGTTIITPLKAIFRFLVDVTKFILGGLVASVLVFELAIINAARAWRYVKSGFKESTEDALAFQIQSEEINKKLSETAKFTSEVGEKVSYAFGGTAQGAVGKLNDKLDESSQILEKYVQLHLATFDKANEKTLILGTRYEQVIANQVKLNLEVKEAYKSNADLNEKSQKIAELRIKQIKAEIEVEKLRLDVVKEIEAQRSSLEIDNLKRSGKTIKAIAIEYDQKIQALLREEEGLRKVNKLRDEDQLIINQSLKLLKQAKSLAVNEEVQKQNEIIIGLEKNILEIRKQAGDQNTLELKNIVDKYAEKEKELGLEQKKLEAQGKANDKVKELIRLAKEANKEAGKIAIKEFEVAKLKEAKTQLDELNSQILDLTGLELDKIDEKLKKDLEALAIKREEFELSYKMANLPIPKERLEIYKKQEAALKRIAKINTERAPSREFEGAKKVGTDVAQGITQAFQSGTAGAVMGAMTGVGAVADVVQGLIDFVPGLLDKIANIYNSLTDLPNKIVAGLGNVLDSILNYYANFIPNLLKMIPAIFEKFTAFFEKLPDVMATLLTNLPDMLSGLLDRLPEVVENFVQKFIEAIPKIAVSLINFLIKDGPRLAIAIAKALTIEIPLAIVKGILDAIKSLPKIFSQIGKGILPKPAEIAKNFALGLKAASKTLTGVASKLFAVMDLEEGAKSQADKLNGLVKTSEQLIKDLSEAAKNAGKSMWNAFVDAFKEALKWFLDRGQEIWDGLVEAFGKIAKWFGDRGQEIWDGFIVPVAMWFKDRGKEIWDGFIVPVAMWFKERGKEIWDGFVVPVAMWFKERGKEIWDGFIEPVAMWFKERGLEIWNGFIAPIGTAFLDAGTQIWRGLYDSVGLFFTQAGNAIWNGFLAPIASFFVDAGTTIWRNFYAAVSNFFEQFGQRIFNGLTGGLNGFDFGNIGNKIWEGLKNGLGGIGGIITDQLNGINPSNFFNRIFSIPGNAFGDKGPVEEQLKFDMPFMKFAKGGMVPGMGAVPNDSKLNDRIVALLSAGEAIIPKSKMDDPAVAGIVQGILSGKIGAPAYALGGVVGSLKKAGGDLAGAFQEIIAPVADILDPAKILEQAWASMKGLVWDKVLDMFWSMLSANKFHDGGLVPGAGEMPSMLKGGEFVLNKSAASSIGVPTLNDLNAGKTPSNNTQNIELNLVINTTQPIDATMIKNKIMPVIREELKRASIDGRTTIYQSGVRTA